MTKRLGSLVGTPKAATPPHPVDAAYANTKDKILVRDTITLAAASIGDTISLGTVGWETILDPSGCSFFWAALGASTTISIGDAANPAALSAAFSTVSANNQQMTTSVSLASRLNPLWQMLGYADLPTAKAVADQCELLATIGGGAATGAVLWQIKGQGRI